MDGLPKCGQREAGSELCPLSSKHSLPWAGELIIQREQGKETIGLSDNTGTERETETSNKMKKWPQESEEIV